MLWRVAALGLAYRNAELHLPLGRRGLPGAAVVAALGIAVTWLGGIPLTVYSLGPTNPTWWAHALRRSPPLAAATLTGVSEAEAGLILRVARKPGPQLLSRA